MSSEDLVRALPRERPETLTAPPDGQILEDIIGDLQSSWGVPPYPQEYRITIKVAEEKDARSELAEPTAPKDDAQERTRPEGASTRSDRPRREKAPAAPGLTSAPGAQGEKPARRRRRRRRRGGGQSPDTPALEGPTASEGPGSPTGEDA